MPTLIDYPLVLHQLQSEGLKCHYYNGGSFGFPAAANPQIRGWLGPPDETIRPEMRLLTRNLNDPYEATLSDWASHAWQQFLPGTVWIMPASHWSFELTHGNQSWLPDLLTSIGIDPGLLIERTNASAIEFLLNEDSLFRTFIQGLLTNLTASDFTLVFPSRKTVCTLHHHKQLWWVTTDQLVVRGLDSLS